MFLQAGYMHKPSHLCKANFPPSPKAGALSRDPGTAPGKAGHCCWVSKQRHGAGRRVGFLIVLKKHFQKSVPLVFLWELSFLETQVLIALRASPR